MPVGCAPKRSCLLAVKPRRVKCDLFFAGLAVAALVHVGDAAAAEPASGAGGFSGELPLSHLLDSASSGPGPFALPEGYTLRSNADPASFSLGPLRAHGAAPVNAEGGATTDEALMHDSPIWQRLADFRNLGRLRVFTFWQTGANSLSLQAGKKGAPSLQWTAKLGDGGPGGGGLFNRVTPAFSSRDLRGPAHRVAASPVNAASPAKPAAVSGPARPAVSASP